MFCFPVSDHVMPSWEFAFCFFSLIMRTFARAWDDIGKKLFPRVASRGLKWENKAYKLKRSINYVLTPLFLWHSPVLQGHNVPIWQRTGRPRNHWALCWGQDLSSSSYKGWPIFFRWPVLRDIRKYLKEVWKKNSVDRNLEIVDEIAQCRCFQTPLSEKRHA